MSSKHSTAIPDHSGPMSFRSLLFAILLGASLLVFWQHIQKVAVLAWHTDEYTHIFMIVPVSLALIYLERRKLRRDVAYAPAVGAAVGGLSIAIAVMGRIYAGQLGQDGFLSVQIASLVMLWMACIVGCFGASVFRSLLFPFLFLFLLVPPPAFLLDYVIGSLQSASTDATFALFKLTSIPVLRDGFMIAFPTLKIEVAKECSGIRSSIMLLITGLILAHLFLRSWWSKLVFVLFIVPFSIAKNALRIFALSVLTMYVDRGFITGRLHHEGGIVFFVIALAGLLFMLWILQRSEARMAGPALPLQDRAAR